MKIGIVTFHFVRNYGGVLQAYALKRYLTELGHEAELIDYHPDWVENGGRFHLPVTKKSVKADVVIGYQKVMNLQQRLFGNKELRLGYEHFSENALKPREKTYRTLKQLQQDPPRFDAYICGSDQIWNPSVQYGLDPAYYLDFGGAKKIAYAASFGRPEIESCYHSDIGNLLSTFSAIGVREKSGAALAHRLSGKETQWVPDPTLLLSGYEEILELPDRENDYLMSYVLRSGDGIGEIQRKLAEKAGLEIIVPYNHLRRWKGTGTEKVCSPGQWLGYIHNSRWMVTNSFHGTLFSVIFKKPFIFYGLGGKKAGLNERSLSFLNRVGLSNRIVTDEDPGNAERLMDEEIDWSSVYERLDEWRGEARSFLADALV